MPDIRHIPDGTKILDPGAYRVSMAHYHSQDICPGPSISSSGIRKIVNQSPWHFWSTWEGNPDRYDDEEESAALILGKAAHCMILGDEVFAEQFCFVPKGDVPRRPTEQQKAAYEAGKSTEAGIRSVEFWRDWEATAAGRAMLTDDQLETVQRMAENLQRCPEAVAALTGGLTEVSMVWQDEETGVWVKARPDVIPDNGADFGDLKTFAPRTKSIERAVHQAITDHGYAIQMALAVMGAEQVFGTSATECVLIMAQSSKPYTVTPVRLDEDALYWGRVMCRHGIDTFARCIETGHWPMPVEGILTYSLPPSLAGRYGEMQLDGRLPNIERVA